MGQGGFSSWVAPKYFYAISCLVEDNFKGIFSQLRWVNFKIFSNHGGQFNKSQKGVGEPFNFFFGLCMFLPITAKWTLIVILYLYGCFVIKLSVRNNKCLRVFVLKSLSFSFNGITSPVPFQNLYFSGSNWIKLNSIAYMCLTPNASIIYTWERMHYFLETTNGFAALP